MMERTRLDAAHEGMTEADAGRLRFFAELADAELFLLLEREAAHEAIEPRLFPLEGGKVALAFDTEERLAAFAGGPVAFAALPGRVLADLLSSQDLGLGLNLDVAPSAMLLPPGDLRWLVQILGSDGPVETDQRIAAVAPPEGLPQALLDSLAERLVRAAGVASRAMLARVMYRDGSSGHLLAIIGAEPRAQDALAQSVTEALKFSSFGLDGIDVAFFDADHPVVERLDTVAMRFDIPSPPARPSATPVAPGMDPDRPPKLR